MVSGGASAVFSGAAGEATRGAGRGEHPSAAPSAPSAMKLAIRFTWWPSCVGEGSDERARPAIPGPVSFVNLAVKSVTRVALALEVWPDSRLRPGRFA